ncbi:MAG: HAMP domain-containing histidine kinase [Candidatus Omnitrophica bacterium]|nr:HAMP domain-containing histidine kinase [Candidatus Omnitrophota bacterium]
MKIAFFRSIRFRIILLYLFILATTLTLLVSALYFDSRQNFQVDLDNQINLKAQGIVDAIQTYWQAEKMEMTKEWVDTYLFFEKKDVKFQQIAHQLTSEKIKKQDEVPTISLIFNSNGELISSSQPIQEMGALKNRVLFTSLRKEPRFDSLRLKLFSERSILVRVITRPVVEDTKVKYVVQVLGSVMPLSRELYQLRRDFFLSIPLILVIAIGGALLLVKVTLNPVDEMVRTIGQIRADTLKLRLKVPHTGDEIARLAEKFNEMLDELERSFSAQRQIVQDISHELKTPLTILQGQQEVALRRDRNVSEYKELLYSNLEEIEKMKSIVNNLLLLARFDRNDVLIEMSSINLNNLLRQILEEIKPLAEAKSIDVQLIEKEHQAIVKGNENYLKILFTNVLDNAIKYTLPGGKITMEVGVFKFFVHVEIKDTGIGISPEDLPHIFDRFYQADKSRAGKQGFGLGLSIVKSITELHEGNIDAQSQLHQGTTITIQIPLLS